MLYLSEAAIAGLAIPPARLREALRRAYRLRAEGRTIVKPKLGMPIGPGHLFQSLCAASDKLGYAGQKWVGLANDNVRRGLPLVSSLVTLSDFDSGLPVAVMQGDLLTILRTAAMSALAAEHLACNESRTIGFVGCGRQAHGHLDALRDVLPELQRALCSSPSSASAERLADAARAVGLDAQVAAPEDVLACDVIVTSVPEAEGLAPFLDAGQLRPGAFVAAPDLARAWHPGSLSNFDIVGVDDREQAQDASTRARLPVHDFAADLTELASGQAPGRRDAGERSLFVFPGHALADLAVAAEILSAAQDAGVGQRLD